MALRVIPPRAPMRAPVPPRARRAPRGRTVAALLAAADAAALLAVCAALARALALPSGPLLTLLPLAAAVFALNAAAGLYRPGPTAAALDELPRLLGHAAIAWCLAAALTPASPPWTWLAAAAAGQAATACAARAAVYHARRRAARRRPRATLVVGTGPAGERVAAALAEHLEYGMRPVGLVGPVPARLPEIAPLPVLTSTRDIGRAVAHHAVRDAVFACPPQERLVRLFWERGCRVWFVDAERHLPAAERTGAPGTSAVAAPATGHLWGFACHRLDPPDARRAAWWGRAGKRALDIAVAATALLLASPVLTGCALAVRLADGPGVIFRQERVGKDGRPFTILKFRTLRPADDREAATRWNIAHDGRMSHVGRLLRRTSLDELPQLWNVLRGDMSLVGPRPERPHFVERFSKAYPGYSERHRVPVGLTGLAQISGLRGDTSIEDRTRFDNHYIDTWSLWQDVRIMLRTTAACFRLGGS
ncbi:exopolysaccharide biosynthesis polyprenyl glycosylphosphotransferase [Streptomyces sp. 6N223]|uniref:exopolysaccharide biosynthesis polyprenyl glycosylphosphotransferase n=1 Tax=Streptomyces sp. 6N223 TaxID=3457412 RepID=UPI003FD6A595